MKQSILYATLAIITTAYIHDALAVTYPYTTTTATTATDSTKTTTTSTSATTTPTTKKTVTPTTTTTKPTTAAKPAQKTATKAAVKPAPVPPPPPKEEPFFSNLSYGVMFISQSVDVENNNGTTTTTDSQSGSGIGLYADKYYQNQYRFNGTFSYISYDNFIITSLTAAADYLYPINANMALFGGVAAGGAGQKYSGAGFSDMSLGLVYGVQLGGILFVSDSLMLELGYRLRMTNLETEIATPVSTTSIDQMNETYLSLIVSF